MQINKQSLITYNKQKKSGIIDMVILIIVVLVIIGFFSWFFLLNKKSSSVRNSNFQPVPGIQTATPEPATTTVDLEAEIKGIQIEDLDTDFSDLDKDINSL